MLAIPSLENPVNQVWKVREPTMCCHSFPKIGFSFFQTGKIFRIQIWSYQNPSLYFDGNTCLGFHFLY